MIKQLFRKNAMIGSTVLIAVFGFATTASADHLQLIQQELNDQRQLWQSLSIDDYNYRFQNLCFCGRDFAQPGLVHVLDGAIVSVEHIDTGDSLDPNIFLTVDGLFDELQGGIDNHIAEIVVEYDSVLGYPTSLYIDIDSRLADEEITHLTSDLLVVPEPKSFVLLILGLVPIFYFIKSR